MLRHLAYVVLFVEDLERSLAFYLQKLGMAVCHRTEGYVERRRVAFVCAPENRYWGQRTAYLRDPDGHLIEFVQNLARRL